MAATVWSDSPPRRSRAAIERTKTPRSAGSVAMRARSPSNAPPVRREDGSTASTPTVSPRARARATKHIGQGRLADAGRAGQADHMRARDRTGRVEQRGERIANGPAVSIAASARAIARLSPDWRRESSGSSCTDSAAVTLAPRSGERVASSGAASRVRGFRQSRAGPSSASRAARVRHLLPAARGEGKAPPARHQLTSSRPSR